ncbi:peptidyl-prolyl cis-trans isomerase [Phycisphaera mikurensis]|uniref:PpiC domain-containing protein n=1 Tax=Phycisphaera mikurensis (strain NBRC 102666 / KCTC 22515 / FYK2301M01) TaxID=1142394 RepID=I0IHC5_PHYMF|nr:peptidyl-prolyl cis-trans isomerase [Phycisphaera mikurensis]MBB6440912.1 hypothetical protein [Phycisphaera mikurensis]BAM04663.1 hypothetical protein PSMK_25040 [Phycisphaera mikurensis NBRC 102666]
MRIRLSPNPNRRRSFGGATAAVAVASCGLLLAGCGGAGVRAVRPADFAGDERGELAAVQSAAAELASEPAPAIAPPVPPGPAERGDTEEAPAGPGRSPDAPAPGGPLVLDAMVGQINGQPVFADDLLADLDAQLAALGRRLEPAVFRERAGEIIEASLRERLVNALILGEAERNLTDNQRAGVRVMVGQRREDLLRRHGRGSLAVARRELQETTGISLDETLRQYRDGLITDNYIRQNLNARINVTRRDVERFYRQNRETFNPPATRDLGLIWVDDAAAAGSVRERLAAGEPFDAVATDPKTDNRWTGGMMQTIVGDEPFGRPAVDAAVAALDEPGDWAGPIGQPGPGGGERFWFVEAAAVERPDRQTLLQAQAAIEQTLRERQFLRLRERFIERLVREGSHTPIEEMRQAVLAVATNRYSRPEA